MGAVGIRMSKYEPYHIHRLEHGICGWGRWRCRLGMMEMVTATAAETGAVAVTTSTELAGRWLEMNLGHALNYIELLMNLIGHLCSI